VVNTGSVPRLGIPSLCLQDGPMGVRGTDFTTAFPAGISVGATWNTTAMLLRGQALGQEFKGKGVNIALGPVVGPLGRKPAGGRNWEGFGADPYLQGVAGAQTVSGIQSAGVISTLKHFMANEQEALREQLLAPGYSANIDDRTLHELYLWPFAEGVKAGAGAVMTAYNQVNNSYASQNSYLINYILKNELGFQGLVMSDWFGQRAGVDSILAGLDMSMPGEQSVDEVIGCAGGQASPCGPYTGVAWFANHLTQAVLNGSVPISRLDDAAIRILTPYYMLGQNSGYPPPNFSANTASNTGKPYPGSPLAFLQQSTVTVNYHVQVNTTQHAKLARDIATEAVTLLKNNRSTLPVLQSSKFAIFGTDAFPNPNGLNSCTMQECNSGVLGMGWGSGSTNYPFMSYPGSSIKNRAPNTVFYNSDTFPSGSLDTSATAIVFINSDSGEMMSAMGALAGQPTNVDGSEGDRISLSAAHNGDALVNAVVAAGFARVIVVVHTVGPVIMESWINQVDAVLVAHLPGQDAGESIADILFGVVNPSGPLPYSIPTSATAYSRSTDIYNPGLLAGGTYQDTYSEGLYIDYRYLNKNNITPRFAFGFGLSYTTFAIQNATITQANSLTVTPNVAQARPVAKIVPAQARTALVASASIPSGFKSILSYIYPWVSNPSTISAASTYPYPPGYPVGQSNITQPDYAPAAGALGGNPALFDIMFSVSAWVSNTGNVTGSMVTQLYITFPSGTTFDTPPIQLRGFDKTTLQPGESALQNFNVRRKDLSVWDTVSQNWIIPNMDAPGYQISLGQSSDALEISCNTASLVCS
jgi:beta-glucosidase